MKPIATQSTKVIVFDFDGTIADSFEVFLEVLATIVKHSRPLTAKQIADLRKAPLKDIIKELGIRPWQIPFLLMRGRREISARMEQIPAFNGIPEALTQLA